MQVIGVADSSRRPSGGQTCLVGQLCYSYDHSYFIIDLGNFMELHLVVLVMG